MASLGGDRKPRVPPAVLALLLFACSPSPGVRAEADDRSAERRAMVETINVHAMRGPKQISGPVLTAVGKVARHEFVPAAVRDAAYEDRPLPIGHGQTISQPYIVAVMTELAELDPEDKVLEVGTGSGYQAAILAELVARVYSIEIVEPLGREAERRLDRLGYANVEVRVGDGYLGWPEQAPFDAILVTAAPDAIPPPLIEQLAPRGRMVIPVGGRFSTQRLTVVEKSSDGATTTREVLPVRFVPLTGDR